MARNKTPNRRKSKSKKGHGGRKTGIFIQDTYRVSYLPFVLTVLFVPLVVRSVQYYNILSEYPWNGGGALYQSDLFLIGKGYLLYILAGLAAFFLLCRLLLGHRLRLASRWLLLPLLYLAMAFVSTLFSRSRGIALKGCQDLHQQLPVLVCYLILFYYTYFTVCGEQEQSGTERYDRAIRFYLRSFLLLSLLLGVTGLFQMFGNDPFAWPVVSRLCGFGDVSFVDSSRIYMTLYHPDYVGVMMVILIPVIVSGAFIEKKTHMRILYGITALLLFGCLLASQSRSGIIALLLTGILLSVLIILKHISVGDGRILPDKRPKRNIRSIESETNRQYEEGINRDIEAGTKSRNKIRTSSCNKIITNSRSKKDCNLSSKIGSNNYTKIIVVFVGLLLLAGVTVAVDRISGGTLSGRFFRFSEAPVKTGNGITGIETGQDQTRIRIRGYDLYLSWTDYGNPKVRDEQGDLQLLSCSKSDYQKVEQCLKNETIRADITEADVMWVEADEFNPCYLIRISLTGSSGGELDGYAVCDGKDVWLVARDSETGSYKILNRQGRLDGCVISEDALPRTLTGFASERGYIWSKTIARLRSVLLIGTGPDTFPLFFPNDDYVQRHLIGKDDTLVNKPHCWYLQMAAETGLLSAVMLVVFIGSYLFHFLKLESAYLMKKQSGFGGSRFAALSDSARVLNLAIGLSVFSYMIVSLANDSMIVCAPVFWVLLGYGSAYCFNDSNLRRRV